MKYIVIENPGAPRSTTCLFDNRQGAIEFYHDAERWYSEPTIGYVQMITIEEIEEEEICNMI